MSEAEMVQDAYLRLIAEILQRPLESVRARVCD